MAKRVFIIHGWTAYPEKGWFPWLKKELEQKDFQVKVPAMPNTNEPKINEWVPFLKELVGNSDEETYFIGHSIGCQTILRYLELLPEETKVGGVVFVAGFVNLTAKSFEEEGVEEIIKEWLETPINWSKISIHTKNFVNVFSDSDLYVPIGDAKFFEEKLGSRIIIEHGKGHFGESDNIKKLPVVLKAILNFK